MHAGAAKQSLPRMTGHEFSENICLDTQRGLFVLRVHGIRLERMKYEHFRQTDG